MSVLIKWLTYPHDAWEAALATQGKTSKKTITVEQWERLVRAEHSPIRSTILRIYVNDISYYSSVHLSRHIHTLHYVSTRRPDLTGRERSVNDTVNHIMDCNIDALIAIARKRLCGRASKETREIVEEIKKYLDNGDKFMQVVGKYMVPNCEYRGKCTEIKPCGRWKNEV